MDQIKVTVIGVRPKFEEWIRERGGVQVWVNINLSDPGRGNCFTPVFDKDGNFTKKPHWSMEIGERVVDITRFKFAKELKEVKRFGVAIRRSSNGSMMKCTDASSAKIHKTCDKFPGCFYRFDYKTQEAVIEVPVWED